ncbi:MAG: hypothetical protein ACE5FT_04430 [Candidatus Nanoarchaeia archaeon]
MTKPEFKFRAGPVEASIWKNETTKEGVTKDYFTVSFQRRYKDKEGAWQSTNSLHVNDLPKAMVVIGKAYEELTLKNVELA